MFRQLMSVRDSMSENLADCVFIIFFRLNNKRKRLSPFRIRHPADIETLSVEKWRIQCLYFFRQEFNASTVDNTVGTSAPHKAAVANQRNNIVGNKLSEREMRSSDYKSFVVGNIKRYTRHSLKNPPCIVAPCKRHMAACLCHSIAYPDIIAEQSQGVEVVDCRRRAADKKIADTHGVFRTGYKRLELRRHDSQQINHRVTVRQTHVIRRRYGSKRSTGFKCADSHHLSGNIIY